MGLFRLILVEYKENIGKAIILIAVSTILSITGLFWFAQRDLVYGAVDIFKSYCLNGKVLVYESALTEDSAIAESVNSYKESASVGSVEICDYYGIYSCLWDYDNSNSDGDYYAFDLFKMPNIKNNPYKMINGRAPSEPNEIMVSSNIRGISVGDHLSNYVVDDPTNQNGIRYIKDVVVTGVFDLNNPLPLDLNMTFQGEYDSYRDNSTEVLQKTGFAFFVSLTDETGEEIQPWQLGHAIIITPAAGYKDSDVVRTLSREFGVENAYDLKRFTKYAENSHEDDMLLFRTLSLVLSVVLLTVNISYCFISLFIKKKELAIYHVLGMPWKLTVELHSFMYLFFVLTGFVLGVILYVGQTSIIKDLAYKSFYFTPISALIVGSVIVGVYATVNLVFYMVTSRKTPIILLRRE